MKHSINPTISIITPVYNGAVFIEDLILSVLNQDYPEIEHIIIDDGSTDDGKTVNILKKYPHLHWWTRENKGQYATMNEGLLAAKGEWVCFISADDLMTPKAVKRVTDFIGKHPAVDAVYGKNLYILESGDPYEVQSPLRRTPIWLYKYIPHITHCSLYVRKSVLDAANLRFDTDLRFSGDYDWILNLIRANLEFGFIDQVLSKIRLHPSQTSIQQENEVNSEKLIIVKRYGVNRFVLRLFHIYLKFYSAAKKAIHAYKQAGFKGVYLRFLRWARRKL